MKYLDICQTLKKSISDLEFDPERRIPSEPELCRRFGTARNTVRQALALLQKQGLIETIKGKGTFITKKGEHKTGVIGLLIPDFSSASFFSSLKSELENSAEKLGYKIRLETSRNTTSEQMVNEIRVAARKLAVDRVEGVIFRPHLNPKHIESNKEILSIFHRTETPVVLIDSDISPRPERSDCDLVAVDNVSAGRRIAAHLLETGRRRLSFMMSGVEIGSNANWENRLFGIAGEVAVRGMDDESFARSSVPPLTTIRQPAGLIAKTVIKTLLARIRYPQNDHREILLDAPLIIRKSSDRRP